MNNLFGKSLRSQMEMAGIKESELADALSYDTTYISKWINGSKLPSARNAERIIGQMADFFADHPKVNDTGDREKRWQNSFKALKSAYASDSSYQTFQAHSNNQMSFLSDQKRLVELTRDAFVQAMENYDHSISITATFDLFRLYGGEFKRLMQELHEAGVKRVELKLALFPEELTEEYHFYAANILNIIGYLDYIEMSIVCQKPEQPHILVINNLLCVQVLWNIQGELAAVFSMEEKVIEQFSQMCGQILEASEKLLDPAEPESLKRTNVQLDSYSDKRQWLFFNEPPAMLFPQDIMDQFIKEAGDEAYASYLIKLKNIFMKRTCKSEIDLVLYSSMINKYLSDGKVSVGNVSHHLSEEQTRSHLRHLSEIMKENPAFAIYLIRDTVVLSEELRNCPSIFIDSYSLYIENSQKGSNDNFHISMDPRMRSAFQQFFEKMLGQPYCTRLTAEDLLRYL